MAYKVGDFHRRKKQGGIPIAEEGQLMSGCFFGGALILCWLGYCGAALGFVAVALFAAFFFRDPERKVPDDPRAIVSPADGRVVRIETISGGENNSSRIEISIFLSIFNVHINRCPISGRVKKVSYKPGSFKAAFAPSASDVNEQSEVVICHDGQPFVVKQIAGLIARRIVCWLNGTETVEKGERFGLIQFGSRVDISMPENLVTLNIKKGDKVKGAISIIGYLKGDN